MVYTWTDNIQAMNMLQVSGYINKVIKDKCDISEDQAWIKELKIFGRQHGDIVRILCVENEGIRELHKAKYINNKSDLLASSCRSERQHPGEYRCGRVQAEFVGSGEIASTYLENIVQKE